MTVRAHIIGNAFRLGDMTPGLEAAIGREMLAAVGRERKRPGTPRNGYVNAPYTGGVYDVARAAILRLLAEGPMYFGDMAGHVRLPGPALGKLLGIMRTEGAIVGDGVIARTTLWRLP